MNPMKNDCVKAVKRVLDEYNIRSNVIKLSKHIRIEWDVPLADGKLGRRSFIISATPSDVRAPLNVAAAVKRMLREDAVVHPTDRAVTCAAASKPFEGVLKPSPLHLEIAKLTARVRELEQELEKQNDQQGRYEILHQRVGQAIAILSGSGSEAFLPGATGSLDRNGWCDKPDDSDIHW